MRFVARAIPAKVRSGFASGIAQKYARAIACFLLLVVVPASAQEGPDISTFTLDNGLQAVVIPDHRSPVVTHMIWYKVGSADEVAGKTGIAHFLEHLMFKGTEKHPAGEFSRRVSEIGGSENAFTSYDYTAYFQQVSPDALPTMMEYEADRMRGLVLTDEVVAPERDVVIEERRSRIENDPAALMGEEVDATLFQNHPYGKPIIGWMHEIEKLNREDAIAFYNLYYAPNNAVLVVAGDVDPDTVRKLAEETYGKVERGPAIPPRIRATEPEQNTARTVSLTDPRVSLPTMQKNWVVPSYTTGKGTDAAALDLLSEILGGGVRSRLYQELVVRKGIASSVGAYYRGTALDDTVFTVYGAPRGDTERAELEAAIDAEISKIVRDGISEDELAKARNRFLRGVIFARDSQAGMARIYGSTLTTGGKVEDVANWPDQIKAVTAAEVQDAARRYLDFRRAVTGYLSPADGDRT